jgi:preprotein translocase subunit SecD
MLPRFSTACEPIITNEHIAHSAAVLDEQGEPAVQVDFTPEGEAAIRSATKKNIRSAVSDTD